jgi:tryptophan halogenase
METNLAASNLKRILICGGGIAAWMAAVRLNRLLRDTGCTITLMESVKLDTSAVGEPSDPSLVKFLRDLKFDEARFMQESSATFQLGTRFANWVKEGQEYWHPFGLCGGLINNIDLFHFWLKSVRAGRQEGLYSSYSLQALLAAEDKAPRPFRGPSPIVERGEYGFHLDTSAFADLLRELATAEGVNQIFDDVRNVVLSDSGTIDRVEAKSGRSLSADLYLDCSGEGVLIEHGLGNPWLSWSNLLPCDRAVALPLPRDPEQPPYVRSTALAAGWMRHVPLSHRVACTYYYSSAHIQDDAALRELVGRATTKKATAAEPRHMKLRCGRRQRFWLKNCVALGPAAGLVEPVEPMDMLFIQKSLDLLIELFPDQSMSEVLSRAYNQRLATSYDAVRDFALLHYLLSGREEPFWRESKGVTAPESLHTLIALHDEHGAVPAELTGMIPEPSYHHIFSGGDRLPRRPTTAADALDFDKVCEIMQQMRAQNAEWIAKLPLHRDLMAALHRPPV